MPPQQETKMTKPLTREQWLTRMLRNNITTLLGRHGASVPVDCKVSVGFPGGGSARSRIGECWPRERSSIKVNEIFINPAITDVRKIVDVLIHEAIHAADNCASGHKGFFRRTAKSVGLTGKMKATVAGPELQQWIDTQIASFPPFAYGSLDLSMRKKQATRMRKFSCDECGAVWRMSGKWSPFQCPCCDSGSCVEG
jgi:hypothetical protein